VGVFSSGAQEEKVRMDKRISPVNPENLVLNISI
jgi:hypothetical protein